MKIDLLINSLGGGGAERVMTTLANGFASKHKIRLITFNEGEYFYLNDKVNRIKLHHGNFNNHTLRSILNLYRYYKQNSTRPDVLISFMPANNLIAIIVAKLLGVKVIISEHTNHTAMVDKKTKWIQKRLYRYANATTVLTSFDESYFEKLGAKVSVMPNPLNLPTIIKSFRKRDKNILIVGSLNRYENKGFDSLLNLIAPILRKNSEWTLTVAGGGDNGMNILKKLTQDLNIKKQVIFTGFCDTINDLMQNSQIFVLSSKYEGLPMGLMEALSNGMACVAYDCPSGPSDLIENNINGLLVNNQNTEAMQNAINHLIGNYTLREKLALNAPGSMQGYSIDNIITKWEELIISGIHNKRFD